jgi:ribosomal protein S18 acetylase RimI-like enzyme
MACRRPKLADSSAIAETHVFAWQHAYAGIMPSGYLNSLAVSSSEARWAQLLRSDEVHVLVVERTGIVCGFSRYGASRDSDAHSDTGEIYAINIHPNHWREGLGSALLSASLTDLEDIGFCRATLWVLESNDGARRFYEARGWRYHGAQKLDAPPGCPELPHVRYDIEVAV